MRRATTLANVWTVGSRLQPVVEERPVIHPIYFHAPPDPADMYVSLDTEEMEMIAGRSTPTIEEKAA